MRQDIDLLDRERYRPSPDDSWEDIDLDEEVVIMDGQRFTEKDARAMSEQAEREYAVRHVTKRNRRDLIPA